MQVSDDEIEEYDRHWTDFADLDADLAAFREDEAAAERIARRIQWGLIAAFVVAVAIGLVVS